MISRWPDSDHTRIGSYVASLDLRNLKSRTCYQQALQAWLRELASRWATSTLLHRARIIDRFLDHLLATGAIDHNPVEALREACHIKQRMPIWRALISCNPEQALARLRQPKPFGSVLGEVMAEHIAMMRRRGYKRGYKYTSQPVRLLQFDRFLHTQLAWPREPRHHQPLRESESGNKAKGTGTGRCSDDGRSSAIMEAGYELARLARYALK